MAKGYPDFFGTSIWPKYGTPIVTMVHGVVIASGASPDLITITANGVLFDLRVEIVGLSDLQWTRVSLSIDGAVMANSWAPLDPDYAVFAGEALIIAPIYYDKAAFIFKVSLKREIPFHDSFNVLIRNDSANNITGSVDTVHYVIT